LACFWNQVINAVSTSCWATFPASNSKQKLKPAAQIMWSVEVNENWFLNRRVPALTTSTAAPICTANHHKILHASYKLPILFFATCRLVNGLAWSSMVQFVSQDLAAASCLTCPTQMLPWWHLEASNHSICTCNSKKCCHRSWRDLVMLQLPRSWRLACGTGPCTLTEKTWNKYLGI
jgi:hypothetical protein